MQHRVPAAAAPVRGGALVLLLLGALASAAWLFSSSVDSIPEPTCKTPLIVAVGDSITEDILCKEEHGGPDGNQQSVDNRQAAEQNSWPVMLQNHFNSDCMKPSKCCPLVQNFGSGGATVQDSGDIPYRLFKGWKTWRANHTLPPYQSALAAANTSDPSIGPIVVTLMMGANDAKPQNWKGKANFTKAYREMVNDFVNLPTKPKVVIVAPTPIWVDGAWQIRSQESNLEIVPIIKRTAYEMGLDLIDAHTKMVDIYTALPEVEPEYSVDFQGLFGCANASYCAVPGFNCSYMPRASACMYSWNSVWTGLAKVHPGWPAVQPEAYRNTRIYQWCKASCPYEFKISHISCDGVHNKPWTARVIERLIHDKLESIGFPDELAPAAESGGDDGQGSVGLRQQINELSALLLQASYDDKKAKQDVDELQALLAQASDRIEVLEEKL